MIEDAPYISIVIPVYNGSKFLPRCLGAIFSSKYSSIEVIVVDDGSTDDSADISRKMGARVIATARQSGPALARNLGAETAVGEVLMFVDADVVVAPNTIEQVGNRFKTEAGISALFGSYDDAPGEPNFLSQYKNLQHHFVHQNSNSEASTFWSGLGAIRRSVFIKQRGFDCRKYSVPSIEDIELGLRIKASGQRIVLDRNIQAKHLKKWEVISHLKTEIFCRALPWSRLILEKRGLVNDMNLKTSDRLSAAAVGLSLLLIPFTFWKVEVVLVILFLLALMAMLNWRILNFFIRKRGVGFALMTLPWQFLYFLYSGAAFGYCWLRYGLPQVFYLRKGEGID
jgi:glycosyltransferase involved in cell wall biosynthesis